MKELNTKLDQLRVKSGVIANQLTQLEQEEKELTDKLNTFGYKSLDDLTLELDGMDTNLDTRVKTLTTEVDALIQSVEKALNGN